MEMTENMKRSPLLPRDDDRFLFGYAEGFWGRERQFERTQYLGIGSGAE